MLDYQLPLRLEADASTQEEKDNKEHAKKRFVRFGIALVVMLFLSIMISAIPKSVDEGGDITRAIQSLINILFILLFIVTGFYFAIFMTFNKKDYYGGYIEVHADKFIINQRTNFVNKDGWENAEIWYEDLVNMRNISDNSNSTEIRLNQNLERYTDGVCFEYLSGRKSNSFSTANWGNKRDTIVFRFNSNGYSKAAVLDMARFIYDIGRTYNPGLEYELF